MLTGPASCCATPPPRLRLGCAWQGETRCIAFRYSLGPRGLDLKTLQPPTAQPACSPAAGLASTLAHFSESSALADAYGHLLTRHNTWRRVRRTGPGVGVGAGWVGWGLGWAWHCCGGVRHRRSHHGGGARRFSCNTSEAVQSSNQPPCAGPPHQSRWLDAITLLLHCGLSGEAAAQHFKAKDTPVTWRGVQSLFSP